MLSFKDWLHRLCVCVCACMHTYVCMRAHVCQVSFGPVITLLH